MATIVGLAGSLRRTSFNAGLLRAAAELAPSGTTIEIASIREIPLYDGDVEREGLPVPVHALKERIAAADGLLLATPEYNNSVPGVLKNAIDWLSRPLATSPLRNKPAAVIGASTGMFGAVWAQAELRKVLRAVGARVIDRELPVATADEIVRDREKLESSGTNSLLVGILAELLAEARPAEATAA